MATNLAVREPQCLTYKGMTFHRYDQMGIIFISDTRVHVIEFFVNKHNRFRLPDSTCQLTLIRVLAGQILSCVTAALEIGDVTYEL